VESIPNVVSQNFAWYQTFGKTFNFCLGIFICTMKKMTTIQICILYLTSGLTSDN